jgi:predicted ArsR family transcriptional regulator
MNIWEAKKQRLVEAKENETVAKIKALGRKIDYKSTKEVADLLQVSEAVALKALKALVAARWSIDGATLEQGENDAGIGRSKGMRREGAPSKYFWFFT